MRAGNQPQTRQGPRRDDSPVTAAESRRGDSIEVTHERRARMKRIVGVHPDWGITVVRIMTGLLFAVHGYQKFAGGLGGVAAFFAKVAIPFSGLMAPLIPILELVAVILLFLAVPPP